MEEEMTDQPAVRGRGRRLGRVLLRSARLLVGPVVITGALFAALYASAGSDSASVDGAQPIDFREECDNEGCAREEVKELWTSFKEECINEGCWMEEVAELGGGGIEPVEFNPDGWRYTSSSVARMMDYFVDELGHPEATRVRVRPGHTDTAWTRLVDLILDNGFTVPIVTCREEASGNSWNCTPG